MAVERTGYCAVCWLLPSDRAELERLMLAGPHVPKGTLARFHITEDQSRYHRKHIGRRTRLTYYRPEEWQRRKRSAQHPLMRRWRWRKGVSGHPGRQKGSKNRYRRRG